MRNVVDYGKNLSGLLQRLSHDTPLLKMLPICVVRDLKKLSKIYGRSGMLVNGILYQLAPLVPRTSGNESGSSPTPRKSVAIPAKLPTPTCRDSGKPLPPRKKNPSGGQKPPLVSVVGGKLQPNFVEWMMGYPPNWTELEKGTGKNE